MIQNSAPDKADADGRIEDRTPASSESRGRVRQRLLEGVALVPVMLTLGNGLAGFASIHFATKAPTEANLSWAAWLLGVSMICDMLDGQVARFARRTSDFGAQLDSLCDAISFGVAPAVLMLRAVVPELLPQPVAFLSFERTVWGVAALYVACAVLRLARFNVEHDQDRDDAHLEFTGLPSPAAAAMIASLVLLAEMLAGKPWVAGGVVEWSLGLALPLVTLAVALLMVSRVPYPHVVNRYVVGKRPFGHAIRGVLIAVAALFALHFTLVLVMALFVLSGPASMLARHVRRSS